MALGIKGRCKVELTHIGHPSRLQALAAANGFILFIALMNLEFKPRLAQNLGTHGSED
ncbi:hypothetical protein PENARI_c295G03534, partial [Penicillium arizonense]